MSLQGIVAITNKGKIASRTRKRSPVHGDDIESKSKTTLPIKLFCDGRSLIPSAIKEEGTSKAAVAAVKLLRMMGFHLKGSRYI
jgi:hypothetical protein